MKRFLGAMAVAVSAAVLSSCQWLLDPATEHNGPQVTVVGDSINVLANVAIRQRVEPSHALVGNAIAGARIGDVLPWLELQLDASPIVVEILGTNDVGSNPDWQADKDRMLADLAGVSCVELVTINQPSNVANRDAFNAALVAATSTHPNMHVIDWAAAVDADPTLVFDGVRPSGTGVAWLGNAYASAIATDCA